MAIESMPKITDILERYGELDWYAIRPSELAHPEQIVPLFPPLITFRFKEDHQNIAIKLHDIVAQYQGAVKWEVGGLKSKNSYLMPHRIKEIEHDMGFNNTMDAIEYMINQEQNIVLQAQVDFFVLMAFLENAA